MQSTDPIQIEVEFFGALREYGDRIALTVAPRADVRQVKRALAEALPPHAHPLLERSALAEEETILTSEWVLSRPTRLLALPPVNGG
ncbi:hypothetical protein CKO15_00530 [Halorhodospira abdelmalekii]|uniref:MoaD/ThiS family protein n=1 Tax=Halorhodospira abdelmalekii TaxID=421629 RepID=UPI0019056DBA|nr:MoaD/ThiS family protein [Halorhodospira abdelmalekii]MBK1733791.1 hypothetical protein [Halorhodospira abdelmalekii]